MPLLSRSRRAAAVATALILAGGPAAAAPGPPSLEYAIKASYLVKFAPFVVWPAATATATGGDATAPMRICVVGRDPFGALLDDMVRDEQVNGRGIAIARMAAVTPATGAACNIMFAGKPDGQPTADMLKAVAGLPVLTVTDRSRGVPGGMIQFVMRGGRVRFMIDAAAAGNCGLQISSKLLTLSVAER